MPAAPHRRRILPGFRLALGYALLYFSLVVLVPLGGLLVRAAAMDGDKFWSTISTPRALAAYRLTFGASLAAAVLNAVFGTILAWVLVRYRFPFRRVIDALVDLPFALPTAVAGIALTSLYAPNGWLGRPLAALNARIEAALPAWSGVARAYHWLLPDGLQIAFTPLGVVVALTFVGLPFVVRTVQPVLEDLDAEIEEAAASLGANRWQTLWRVILPEIRPALATGFALAMARAIGEYGSVIFIAGNIQMRTEIAPLLIIDRLEQYDYAGATAIAVVMLIASFILLLTINLLQRWAASRAPAAGD